MGEVGGKERNGDTGLQADRNEEIHFNMGKKKVKCEKTEVELKKRKDQLGWQKERT